MNACAPVLKQSVKSITKLLAVAFAAALIASPAAAALVLDQNVKGDNRISYGNITTAGAEFRRVQTVTAGVSGLLSEIRLILNQVDNPIFEMRLLKLDQNGAPTDVLKGSASFSSVSGNVAVFNAATDFVAGETFAIEPVLISGFARWEGSATYDNGAGWFKNPRFGIRNFQRQPSSFSFSTYVDVPEEVAAVPEASTWAMMIGGFGMIGGAMRRRSKTAMTLKLA